MLGGTEETTTGLVRLRALEAEGGLAVPVIAVNEARAERAFNDRFGAGQSVLDGIVRATNLLLAGQTVVVLGYGWTGRGVALRAAGFGASVIVCEVDPLRALEARMEGFAVMPALEAAARGDIFITVTGVPDVLRGEHFCRMKDGAVLANAGQFDVEISLADLRAGAVGVARDPAAGRALRVRRPRAAPASPAAGSSTSPPPRGIRPRSWTSPSRCRPWPPRRWCAGRGRPGVHAVPDAIEREVAALKLAALDVEIDTLTDAQADYLSLTSPPRDR